MEAQKKKKTLGSNNRRHTREHGAGRRNRDKQHHQLDSAKSHPDIFADGEGKIKKKKIPPDAPLCSFN